MKIDKHHYPKWIWHSKIREMTWVLFRREFNLSRGEIKEASGIVSANTRYNLYVNGTLVQRGPAPFDPRFQESDPVELKPYLKEGKNVIGALVCYFGRPDGTYVAGIPGFLFGTEINCGGTKTTIYTDASWKCLRSNAWQDGFARSIYRAIVEKFDARLFPYGWLEDGFDDSKWQNVIERMAWSSAEKQLVPIPFGKPSSYSGGDVPAKLLMELRPRTIANMAEIKQPHPALICSGRVEWNIAPEEYFEYKEKTAYKEFIDNSAPPERKGETIKVSVENNTSAGFVYDLGEVMVGYPYFKVKAPAGTIFELIFAEVRDEDSLITPSIERYGCWGRYIAREGENLFECFDYEETRYITILVRNASGPVEISEVGFLRRIYEDFVKEPEFECSDDMALKIFGAAKNTLRNAMQDIIVDNVMRERAQWSGELGVATLGAFYGFGDTKLAERRLRTKLDGQKLDGGFFGCWPGSGCLNNHLTNWILGMNFYGPEFIGGTMFLPFDAENLFMWSGRKKMIQDIWPKFLKYDAYVESYLCKDGLLPVENWKWASVYIDCEGFERENDKRAVLNHGYLMYLNSMKNMAMALGEDTSGFEKRIKDLITDLRATYWCGRRKLIVDNLPTEKKDKKTCLYDRTIAMALIYGSVPIGEEKNCLDVLETVPSNLGLSSPVYTCWRLWALFRFGRGNAAVKDMIKRWGAMRAVHFGNCISERWDMTTSSLFTESGEVIKPLSYSKTMATEAMGGVWCQNETSPLFLLIGDVMGVKPLEPGFKKFQIRPQPGSIQWLKGVVHAPTGDIRISIKNENNTMQLDFESPPELKPVIITEMGRQVEGAGGVKPIVDKQLNVLKWELPLKKAVFNWNLRIK